jgi:4-amino-4-deoxy-L-arabinose transferase-like glycosyltransferase
VSETFPARRLLLVVLLAAALRAALLAQAWSGPLAAWHRWQQSDMAFFHDWARVVAGGDLLQRKPLHPTHDFHLEVAAEAMRLRPDLADRHRGDPRSAWAAWHGGARWHQAPLYPHAVGLAYALAGRADPRVVFVAQALLGVLSTALAFLVARRAFGDDAALGAGLLAATSAPLAYLDVLLLRAGPIVFATLLFGWLLGRAREPAASPRAWLLVGLAGGLGILLKPSLALLPMGGLALLPWSAGRQRALARAALLLGGLALALAPAAARNLAVGVGPLALSSVATTTFVNANAVDYDPRDGWSLSAHAPAILADSEGRFLPAARAALATHGGAASLLRQQAAKLGCAAHWLEMRNNQSFYLARQAAPVLWAMPAGFGLVGTLGIVGLVLAALRRGPPAWEPWLLVAAALVPLQLFYSLGRLRAALLAALLPFAGIAVERLARWLRDRRGHGLTAWAGLALVAALVVLQPAVDVRPLVRAGDVARAWAVHHGPRAEAAEAAGRPADAAKEWSELIALSGAAGRRLERGAPARNPEEGRLAGLLAVLEGHRAAALVRAGRGAEARAAERRAEALRIAARREDAAGGR